MALYPTWPDIVLRIVLTMLAGVVIGFNREERGRAAGFRTTILVGLAASVAMIQANLLLPVSGKTPSSFAVLDLMRLPLGILTGVGFIGGGAILKKGRLVTGVTTAATLWVTTVIGLCIGGGQIALGMVATLLTVATLWALKWVDWSIPRWRTALISVEATDGFDICHAVLKHFHAYRPRLQRHERAGEAGHLYVFELSWKQSGLKRLPADLLDPVESHWVIVSCELLDGDEH